MFEKWNVMSDKNGNHKYFYGSLDEYLPEELEGIKRVPEEKYTPEDIAILFGNEMENKNYHRFTNLGEDVLSAIRSVLLLTSEEECEILKAFVEKYLA